MNTIKDIILNSENDFIIKCYRIDGVEIPIKSSTLKNVILLNLLNKSLRVKHIQYDIECILLRNDVIKIEMSEKNECFYCEGTGECVCHDCEAIHECGRCDGVGYNREDNDITYEFLIDLSQGCLFEY